VVLLLVTGELWFNGYNAHPTAPRETIYPQTALTTWLQRNVKDGERILFLTPRRSWGRWEDLQTVGRNHPPGVLPPNGATVYGLHDVNGYDSLAPLAYRQFVNGGEGEDVAPQLNGNMILLQKVDSPALDALNVRYVVALETENLVAGNGVLTRVLSDDGAVIYRRSVQPVTLRSGADFYPGWRESKYQPQSFRVGTFLALCAVLALGLVFMIRPKQSSTGNGADQ
jgi:hypothetical protein